MRNGRSFGRSRTLAKCTAQHAARYRTRRKTAEACFKIFTAGATFCCEDGQASLGAFNGSLRNFNWSFECAYRSARCYATTKAGSGSLCSFSSGATKKAACPKRGDVNGTFERSLSGGGSSSSTRAGDITLFLDLTLNVGAEEGWKSSSRAAR